LSFLVDVPLARLREAAEDAFPPEVGREDAWVDAPLALGSMGLQFQYRFWRGPVGLEEAGGRPVPPNHLRFPVRGRGARGPGRARLSGGRVPLQAQCGYDDEPPRRLRIGASSRLSWTASWGLRSATALGAPEFVDACRAFPGGADIAPVLAALLQPGLETLAAT